MRLLPSKLRRIPRHTRRGALGPLGGFSSLSCHDAGSDQPIDHAASVQTVYAIGISPYIVANI